MKLPASFIADEVLPKSFIADKPLPSSFVPDEAPPLPESIDQPSYTQAGASQTVEAFKPLAKAIGAEAKFGAAIAKLPVEVALGKWRKGFEDIKQAGEKAPIGDVSNILSLGMLAYGGVQGVKAIPELIAYAKSSNFAKSVESELASMEALGQRLGKDKLAQLTPDAERMLGINRQLVPFDTAKAYAEGRISLAKAVQNSKSIYEAELAKRAITPPPVGTPREVPGTPVLRPQGALPAPVEGVPMTKALIPTVAVNPEPMAAPTIGPTGSELGTISTRKATYPDGYGYLIGKNHGNTDYGVYLGESALKPVVKGANIVEDPDQENGYWAMFKEEKQAQDLIQQFRTGERPLPSQTVQSQALVETPVEMPTETPASPTKFNTLPEKSQTAFNNAWQGQDVERMKEILHPANKILRAEFESRAGVKLPKGYKATKTFLDGFAVTNAERARRNVELIASKDAQIVAIEAKIARLENAQKTGTQITPIIQPKPIVELGAGPFPPKVIRDTLNSALASALPAEEKVNAMWQVLKFYLGTKRERFQVMAGDKIKGDEWYNEVRAMDANINSANAIHTKRAEEIFHGLRPEIRAHIYDIAKGIDKNADGEVIGGFLQPAGLMRNKNLHPGQILPDGRIVGNLVEDSSDEYKLFRKFNTLVEYNELIKKYPQAKVVFDKYLAEEENPIYTKLGTRVAAFARKVIAKQYNIHTNQPAEVVYVPSVRKEDRFFAKIGNLFKSYIASGRKGKTGILAETEQEDKDLFRTLVNRENDFFYEDRFNKTVGKILATILEPIEKGGVKPGFKEVNIHNPKLKRILDETKDLLLANGIDVTKPGNYQYPINVDKEFNLSRTAKFSPEMQSIVDSTERRTNQMVGFILSNYLIRPSTAVRNATSGFVQYNLRTLTHLYEGILGEGFSPAVNDVKALVRSFKPSVIKELPAEILGLNFFSDIPENVRIMQTALIPFKAVEIYYKRASFDADLSTVAGNKFNEALQAGTVRVSDKNKFIQDYRINYFQDLFNTMSDNADSVTFDYGNKPYVLEKMSNTIGRGFVPYPNYMYHKWRMYAEYSPLQLRGMNKFNYKNKIAKAMAGMTTFTIAAAMAAKIVEERKEKLKKLELKKLPWEMDTTGRLKIYADDTVERWLRIYDLPFIGDTVYMMEILQNQAGIDDWMRDSLSMGPIFNTMAMFMGLRTKYTSGLATASIAGQQAVGFIPFGAYIQYLRVLADPVKRQTFSKDYNAFQNFISPIINVIPDVSKGLPPQIGRIDKERGQIRKYDIPAETMKLFFLNIRSIDKKEYQQYVNVQMRNGKVMKRITKNIKESRIAGRNQ